MTKFFDISDWRLEEWNNPQKGSRPNSVFVEPYTGDLYFFKQSKAIYPSEIWSEIIASKLGQLLGFNVLDYNFARYKGQYGCISKSMVQKTQNEILLHGIDVLKDYLLDFEVTKKPVCSFQDWLSILKKNQKFTEFLTNFIEIAILDTIVGNTDRHTENWAFIRCIIISLVAYPKQKGFYKKILNLFKAKNKNPKLEINFINYKFAPIYDTGSCLGREMSEEKIISFLNNSENITRYIERARSEIRWNNTECSLFDLTKYVHSQYPDIVNSKIKVLYSIEFPEQLSTLVDHVDRFDNLDLKEKFLSENRKRLIKTLLNKRIEYIKTTLKND